MEAKGSRTDCLNPPRASDTYLSRETKSQSLDKARHGRAIHKLAPGPTKKNLAKYRGLERPRASMLVQARTDNLMQAGTMEAAASRLDVMRRI